MAISPGFEHDIFVSYSHIDNEEGWVTQFEERLSIALLQRLGGAGKLLNIFFDREATGANYQLPSLLSAVRTSALFLAIGSPSYIDSSWSHSELQTFAENANDLSRIFLVEFLPLNEGQTYPAPIQDHIRQEFWRVGKYRHTPMWLSPTTDAEDFASKVHALAIDLKDKLISMRFLPARIAQPAFNGAAVPGRIPPSQSGAVRLSDTPSGGSGLGGAKKTILLAQGTDDVEDEAEQLRRFLKQYESEVAVLPASGYPQGGDAFHASVSADLARAGLFVQLLGKRAGRTPPDLPEGYPRCQLDAAQAAGITIMQWRHPEIGVDSVTDTAWRNVLTAATVVASGLEAFKQQILRWIREPAPRPRTAKSSTVFINADEKDMKIAKQVQRECLEKALTTILPYTGSSPDVTRKDLVENLTDCDILVFIYGDTTLEWIRAQLKFFNKVKSRREAEPKLLAICSGPPPKEDIGISFPNAHMIDCPDGWNLEPIRSMLAVIED
jgi:TIR domain